VQRGGRKVYAAARDSVLGGKGIGRYGAAQLTDVTFDATGAIKPISEIQALAGLIVHASPKLDVYAYASEEKESAQAYFLTIRSERGRWRKYAYEVDGNHCFCLVKPR
jgi:hypothetical protein